jgi:hypothetical protein
MGGRGDALVHRVDMVAKRVARLGHLPALGTGDARMVIEMLRFDVANDVIFAARLAAHHTGPEAARAAVRLQNGGDEAADGGVQLSRRRRELACNTEKTLM